MPLREERSDWTEICVPVSASTHSTTRSSVQLRKRIPLIPLKTKGKVMKILRTLFLLLSTSTLLYAQQPATVITKQTRCRTCVRRIVKSGPVSATVPQPAPDFFIGEAKVDLVKDQTVVR